MDEKQVRRLLKEDFTKGEINDLISNKIVAYAKSRDFEEKVKQLASDVFENFFKLMYTKRTFWQNEIKHG